ncbi:hypothetical protein DEO72_LG6g830 [Vigna unguiculata]|uniref:Uncharacterized protein n=1 Tax=Vigna unguiculata TaxID=3917 RepID=A0A4D6M6H4_VIGUN|nr:hypothetical protein DEO72_LG6g830 [Vigna unguiculata]
MCGGALRRMLFQCSAGLFSMVTDYYFAMQVKGVAAMVAATGSSLASMSERCSDGCDANVGAQCRSGGWWNVDVAFTDAAVMAQTHSVDVDVGVARCEGSGSHSADLRCCIGRYSHSLLQKMEME